jgi:hypothetical protein|tara:strand:+ start:741 stop:980 length:240 start_codon:yes stop_codon:yes gene_type:complete
MGMISITKLAQQQSITTKDVRSIARHCGLYRTKVGKLEFYDGDAFEKALAGKKEKMKKRTLTADHLKKMQDGKDKKKKT